ncbi:hypothetical protein GGI15_000405 [Coemansia interrupta]|uniref:Uncharacterized protein n=1 Tax=Coemansia interrupta TaxID=1126814 RepID=A0A9W8LPW0_9FUNG|nr:hypothetical protein GGI15_000405 [Coemansia interrupta]
MSAAQPFPVLASADNSRAGSPAPSAGSPGAPRGGRGKGKGKGGSKQASRGKENGAAAGDKAVAGDKAMASKPRHKKPKSKAKNPAVAAVEQQQGSETSSSSSNGAGRGGKGRGKKRQDGGTKGVAAAAADKPAPASPTPAAAAPLADEHGRRPKKAGKGSQRRRTVATPQSAPPMSATPPPAPPAAQPMPSRNSVSLARSSSSGALPLAMIVAGENGRARVLFSPAGVDNDHPLAHAGMSPRFSVGAVQSARAARVAPGYGDGLGLRSPMSPAHHAQAPGLLRQRSMTSAHHHGAEPQWQQHHHQQQWHSQQQQHHQQWHGQQQQQHWHAQQEAPLTAPEVRGRSQSMHMSMTGLRISLAQSRPGNVLSPHIALPPRASNAPASVQTNTYANNGYFATRRASLSNVGLAVDPSHSIRIPTIMFEKPKKEDLARASAQKTAALAEEASETKAEGGAPPTPVSAEDGSAGEMLAMQRLQEMIASMRKIAQPPAAKKAEPVALAGDVADEPADAAKNAVVQMPPTPAAHPTSRFDSILEEDEDGEDDEAILDEEEEEPKSSAASAAAASAAPALLAA